MQLSPLQSRLAASVVATVLLIILYLSLFNPQFALAEQIDHGSPIVLDDPVDGAPPERDLWSRGAMYEPDFDAFDRSIVGRAPLAPRDTISLSNNVGTKMNLDAGESLVFVLDSSQLKSREDEDSILELRDEREASKKDSRDSTGRLGRRASSSVYISANTCLQPSGNSTSSGTPPQLTLYVSTSSDNTSPGPSANSSQQEVRAFDKGAVMYNLTTSGTVYIGVGAANVSSDFSGIYNVQVGASVDGWYHTYNSTNKEELFWVDSDTTSVLLMTQNLTTDRSQEDQVMTERPYAMFAQNDADPSINGLENSYCGLDNNAQIAAVRNGQTTTQVTTGMTKRGSGGYPKQQFYFSGLNSSSNYVGILARNVDNSSNTNVVGGGGSVYRATRFSTKSSYGNCALIFNLTFCDEVAYAVPSNNQTFSNTSLLGQWYDDQAQSYWDGFNKSMQMIPCEADDTQQFSLVRNCTTCKTAYKDWLCSVTIPRCEDFTATDSFLQPRAMNTTFPDGSSLSADLLEPYKKFNNQLAYLTSRNTKIDEVVKPGPYKEVLPCEELCYDLVQSCPSALGFACPRPWNIGFNGSYGSRIGSNDGNVTCNYPGSFHFYSAAGIPTASWLLTASMAAMAAMIVLN